MSASVRRQMRLFTSRLDMRVKAPNVSRLKKLLSRVDVGENEAVEDCLTYADYLFRPDSARKAERRVIVIWSSPKLKLPASTAADALHRRGIGITYISLDTSTRMAASPYGLDRVYNVGARVSLLDILRRELGPNPIASRVVQHQYRLGLKRQLAVAPWWNSAKPCPKGASLSKRAGSGGRVIECRLPGGTRHGRRTAWYADKKTLLADATYLHGKLNGLRRRFHTTGALESIDGFRNGVRHGRQRAFAKNGLMVRDVVFRLGRRHGPGRHWTSAGQLISKTHHRGGNAVGTWQLGSTANTSTSSQRFASDRADGDYVVKWLGEVVVRGKYRRGHKIGVWRRWWEGGKKKSVGAYRNNRRHGTWKYFTEKGQLRRKVVYRNGIIQRTLWF